MVSKMHMNALNIGSHFLGSGGGEDTLYSKVLAEYQLEKSNIKIISSESLKSNDLIVLISGLGCAFIEGEKLHNTLHFDRLFQKVEKIFNRSISAVGAVSIGGGTVFVPLFLASRYNLPFVDGDFIGRCSADFKSLSTNLKGIGSTEAFVANLKGHIFEMSIDNLSDLENYMNSILVSSGGFCTMVPQILTGEQVKKSIIPGTLTQALTIGEIIEKTHSFADLAHYTKGRLVGIGGVMDIEYVGVDGPFRTHIIIKNMKEHKTWEIYMDNEYNILLENGKIIAELPDIITLCHPETCVPFNFNHLYYGVNVAIFTMKAPDIWYTQKGLNLIQSESYLKKRATVCVSA